MNDRVGEFRVDFLLQRWRWWWHGREFRRLGVVADRAFFWGGETGDSIWERKESRGNAGRLKENPQAWRRRMGRSEDSRRLLWSLLFLTLLPCVLSIYCDEDDCYDLLGWVVFSPSDADICTSMSAALISNIIERADHASMISWNLPTTSCVSEITAMLARTLKFLKIRWLWIIWVYGKWFEIKIVLVESLAAALH